ncbi:MAG: prepilin-type N-terminal cleavage/methylation domain-containing protein [Kiritimatiellae bacterium]|jgi:type II secretion system protein G|nr:prepilin-type N-terminal cleavage/methylation domain-containing protein [Kiritimatiellia bacterium]
MIKNSKKGFTLVEMLVVIAIIGILMALLFPAFTSVVKKAKVTKAKTEVAQIEQAWKQFLMDYKEFPPSISGQVEGMSSDVVKHLTGDNDIVNIRKTMYMELDPDEIYKDPWGRAYNIQLDVSVPQPHPWANDVAEINKQVLVWSYGPNLQDVRDNISNWR